MDNIKAEEKKEEAEPQRQVLAKTTIDWQKCYKLVKMEKKRALCK